jgi:outer membrane lipoprotein-sorting protein
VLAQSPIASPVVTPASPPVATPDRASIIDRAGLALAGVKTAEGRFTQTDPGGGQSSGKFYISRPGKVRFEYTSPEPMFIVSDGVSVSIEEPRRKSYDAVPLSSTPLHLFLRSNVDLKKDGSVTDVDSANGSHFVTLEDRSGEAEGRMILEFRAADFELLGWRAIDGTGSETRVRLADTRTNVTVRPALFIVRDPADQGRR